MAIMSRGVTPREFNDCAIFSTVGNSGKATICALFSVTSVLVRGVTTVVPPLLNGWGCETSRVEAMLMVMFPCETAQLEIRMRDVNQRKRAFADRLAVEIGHAIFGHHVVDIAPRGDDTPAGF